MPQDVLRHPPPASSEAVRASMLGNRSTDTGPETALRSLLHRRGLRFRKNAKALSGLRCRPDVVFPRARVAVFVDGCFWHRCPVHATTPRSNAVYWQAKFDSNMERDRRIDSELAAAGWLVVRAWEHEDSAQVADRVEALVRERLGGSGQEASTDVGSTSRGIV